MDRVLNILKFVTEDEVFYIEVDARGAHQMMMDYSEKNAGEVKYVEATKMLASDYYKIPSSPSSAKFFG